MASKELLDATAPFTMSSGAPERISDAVMAWPDSTEAITMASMSKRDMRRRLSATRLESSPLPLPLPCFLAARGFLADALPLPLPLPLPGSEELELGERGVSQSVRRV